MFNLTRKRARPLTPKLARGPGESWPEMVRRSGLLPAFGLAMLFWVGVVLIIGCTPTGLFGNLDGAGRVAGLTLMVGLVTVLVGAYVFLFQRDIIDRGVRSVNLVLLALAALLVTRLCVMFGGLSVTFFTVATASVFAFVLAMSYPRRSAFGLVGFMNLLTGLALSDVALADDFGPKGLAWLPALVLTLSVGTAVATFSLRQVRNRTRLIEIGLWSGLAFAAAAFSSHLYLREPDNATLGQVMRESLGEAVAAFSAGLSVGIFVTALLPYIERLFDITTSISLIELSDANHPLLRRMALDAPGTFNHSLLIGTMCEAAAEEIGGDGLLCRVGCYYHDIGKLLKPDYYIENQAGGDNKHDSLSPSMSKLIISGHPREGLEMAIEAGLPTVLHQFIMTHHGTTVMEYFYRLACSQRKEGDPDISDADFRYPGPKPQTREAAVVMLADGVEGAVRALAEPTPGRINDVVHAVAMKRLMDGQFGECELTLADLNRIEQSFIRSLCSHYHGRIAYPASSLDNAAKIDKIDSTLRGAAKVGPEGSGRGVNAPIRAFAGEPQAPAGKAS